MANLGKKTILKKEQELTKLARIAWNKTLAEFYFPPLNEPRYIFDYTLKEGFYIDPQYKWQITMNLANAPSLNDEGEYINYFHIISMHEVSHYEIIPYDGLLHAKLLKAANKHINHNLSPILVNIFADLIIDYKLFRKYPELMIWEMRKSFDYVSYKYKSTTSDFSKFLYRTYEKLLNFSLLDEKLQSNANDKNKSNEKDIYEKIYSDELNLSSISKLESDKIEFYQSLSKYDYLANEVCKVILKDFEDETLWEKKVSKISKILKELILQSFNLKGKSVKSVDGKAIKISSNNGDNYVEFSEDILEVMDNPLEIKNHDKLKELNDDDLRQKAEDFAKDTPFSEFGSPAQQAGILKNMDHLATWYRGLAKNLIQIKIFEKKPGGEIPISTNNWRIGDPLEELDVVQTVLTCPLIIPNITTKKWVFKEGPSSVMEKQIPDLLIVLDSSGSMKWNYIAKKISTRGTYHTALIASFAAMHYAANKGVKFSIINFSAQANICPWTVDYHKAEETLLRYQGAGTILPIKAISTQCKKAEKKVLIFIITDFGIYNWKDAKKSMVELTNEGHKIVGFFIGTHEISSIKFKDLMDKVAFYPIINPNDLIDLVIEEVKKHYS